MTAEDQGRRLLAQIAPAKSLDELISSLICTEVEQDRSPPSPFGYSPIDRCLADLQHRRSRTKISSRQSVLELTSSHHGAGKTQLLYAIASSNVLLKGNSGLGAIVVLDADNRFDVSRLVDIMRSQARASRNAFANASEARESMITAEDNITAEQQIPSLPEDLTKTISHAMQELDESSLDHMVEEALDHVHIFRPTSFAALISTIRQLPNYLFGLSNHPSYDRQLRAILLDSADAFYWDYRAEQDSHRDSIPSHGPSAMTAKEEEAATYRLLTQELRSVAKTFSCPVIATTTEQASNRSTSRERSELMDQRSTSMLPTPWHSFPTLRLQVHRESVTRFAPYISAEQALRERSDRQKVVDQARFSASLIDGPGGFGFRIIPDGVHTENT